MIELCLVWKPKIVSWIILSPTLKPIKGVYAWATSKAKNSQDVSLLSASPSHFIIIKVQAYQVSSTLNGSRRSKWLSLVCLFIPCFYVSLNSKNPCSIWCTLFMYIFKKKKIIKIPKSFPKKREKFSKKKNLWTRDIGLPIDFFKKRSIFFFQRFQDSLKSSFQNGTWGSLGQNFF